MNGAITPTALAGGKFLLTVPGNEGQNYGKFRQQAGISYANNVVGTDQARRKLEPKGVTLGASFFMHGRSTMVNRAGLPKGCAGPLVRFLVDPYGSPPITDQEMDGDCKPQSLEDQSMSQDNSARASCALVTQSDQHADGTTSEIRWIKEATCIKRLRRHLAKSGCTLHITREGSPDRQRHGEYFIRDQDGQLIDDKINLASWLRSYGLLASDERIDPPHDKGWKFFVARQKRVVIDGISCWGRDQLTAIYSTERAARKAAEGIVDRENLIIVGYDATATLNLDADRQGDANG